MIINCDGGARGNPGPAASAFVVIDDQGKRLYQQGNYLGKGTNNQAEYDAVWMAVNWLSQNLPDAEAQFVLDSQLVTNQLSGQFKIKNPQLKKVFTRITNFIFENRLKISGYDYVPRHKNSVADNLVNKILDQHLL